MTLAVALSCGGPFVAGAIVGGFLGFLLGAYSTPPGGPSE